MKKAESSTDAVPQVLRGPPIGIIPDRQTPRYREGDTVSQVSKRISESVALQGRLQSAAAQCAAHLERVEPHSVALMFAYLLGWESRSLEELDGVKTRLVEEEQKRALAQATHP